MNESTSGGSSLVDAALHEVQIIANTRVNAVQIGLCTANSPRNNPRQQVGTCILWGCGRCGTHHGTPRISLARVLPTLKEASTHVRVEDWPVGGFHKSTTCGQVNYGQRHPAQHVWYSRCTYRACRVVDTSGDTSRTSGGAIKLNDGVTLSNITICYCNVIVYAIVMLHTSCAKGNRWGDSTVAQSVDPKRIEKI